MLRFFQGERRFRIRNWRGGSGPAAVIIIAAALPAILTPTSACAEPKSLTSGSFVDSSESSPGLMFDVAAKVPIQITGISHTVGHSAGSPVSYKVYTKRDSFDGSEHAMGDWISIGSGTVTSEGPSIPTTFPITASTIPLMATNERRAFYITTTTLRSIYQPGTAAEYVDVSHTRSAENSDMWISEAISVSYEFLETSFPWVWNGTVYYDLATCSIDGVDGIPHTSVNMWNECQFCDAVANPAAWTPRPANTSCNSDDDGYSCTSNICNGAGQCTHPITSGCLIPGVGCVDENGLQGGSNRCVACLPSISNTSWTFQPPGTRCDAVDDYSCTTNVCDGSGTCIHPVTNGCLIAGDGGKACFQLGEYEPQSGSCKICTSANPIGWTNAPYGQDCDSDGLPWTIDKCDGMGNCTHTPTGGCYIDDEHVENGAVNPKNPCEECNSGALATSWTLRLVGTDCPSDNLDWTVDQCDGMGTCTHEPIDGCMIDGSPVPVGDVNPRNECQWCNPAASASSWSARAKGTECESDARSCTRDQCDGFGRCEHSVFVGCLIHGFCVDDRASDPDNDCMECNPAQAIDRYSPKADGETCDENRACDGSGHCFELPPGNCTIDGVDYANGAPNIWNSCQRCDVFMNPNGWTNRAKGAACTDDGLFCTSNSCDGFGTCDVQIITGCLIGGKCVENGAKNSQNECEQCDPGFSN
ncbi:MAG: hypothetical protein FWD57_12455, partial [Polyangiaceae bacterium]|nr:hypothetical protein [Polyangiaceae bacterium]